MVEGRERVVHLGHAPRRLVVEQHAARAPLAVVIEQQDERLAEVVVKIVGCRHQHNARDQHRRARVRRTSRARKARQRLVRRRGCGRGGRAPRRRPAH
eukprot:scaffold3520_cov154-Isochrysis_galbana.AAC.6